MAVSRLRRRVGVGDGSMSKVAVDDGTVESATGLEVVPLPQPTAANPNTTAITSPARTTTDLHPHDPPEAAESQEANDLPVCTGGPDASSSRRGRQR